MTMGKILADGIRAVLEDVLGEHPSNVLRSACYTLMALVEASSPDGGLLIYMFGLKLGERIGSKLPVDKGSLESLSSIMEALELAKLSFEWRDEGLFVKVESSEEIRKIGSCNFTRGFIAGFLSKKLGKPIYVEEEGLSNQGCSLIAKPLEIPETNSTRQAIIEYLRVNPGAHLRQISRDLGLSLGTLRWHLNVLERSGLVKERRRGNMTQFYLADL